MSEPNDLDVPALRDRAARGLEQFDVLLTGGVVADGDRRIAGRRC